MDIAKWYIHIHTARIAVLLFTVQITVLLHAQQIQNVQFQQSGNEVIVTYDLINTKDWQTFDVELFLSENNGYTYDKLKAVKGDVGYEVTGGYNKRIVWEALREREEVVGSRIKFKVEATIKRPKPIEGMVFVEGGTFQMGSEDGDDDEKPVHTVTVSSFYMSKYEVTQKQWREVMGTNPSLFKNCDNCPVEQVSWNDIQDFLKKLNQQTGNPEGSGYRLPTEAEWEYAARGGNKSRGYKYAGSNTIGAVAWYFSNISISNSGSKTHPVGQKQPNELGLYDMSGNVWEWCSDWYDSKYYSRSASTDPQGPSSGSYRVFRGGCWSAGAGNCRVANRSLNYPTTRYYTIGFRLAFVPSR